MNKTNKYLRFLAVIFLAGFLFFGISTLALADDAPQGPGDAPQGPGPSSPDAITSLEDPLQGGADKPIVPADIINRLAAALVAPVGALAFVFLVVGGFYWIFSAGNEERVKTGKDIILWTVVGIIIVFSSYAILSFVFKILLPVAK